MEEIVADKLFILISSTLLLCYLSGLFYKKTKIPDIIWVLGFGILLGPVLGYFDKDLFLSISPMMSTIALSVILFDAGINVDIKMLIKTMVKATLLSVAMFFSVVLSVGLLVSKVMPGSFKPLEGMLLGSMIGGSSTIAVFGIVNGLRKLIKDIESTSVILMMESVLSDPICIIASITIIRMIMLPGVSVGESLVEIITTFIFSSAAGLVLGLLWAEALDRLRGRPLTYMMTLSVLFPAYVLSERIIGEGGGPMTALTFGLAITNFSYIVRRVGFNKSLKIDKKHLREFHEEVTFLIKSFFFVYIGLIVTISMQYIKIGLIITALVLVIRFIVATAVGKALDFSRTELVLTRVIFAQGLPAFVMSQLPFIFDPGRERFLNPEIYPNLCVPIVLGTVLFAAIAGPLIAKMQLTTEG
jgi:cell volume regulation protein A